LESISQTQPTEAGSPIPDKVGDSNTEFKMTRDNLTKSEQKTMGVAQKDQEKDPGAQEAIAEQSPVINTQQKKEIGAARPESEEKNPAQPSLETWEEFNWTYLKWRIAKHNGKEVKREFISGKCVFPECDSLTFDSVDELAKHYQDKAESLNPEVFPHEEVYSPFREITLEEVGRLMEGTIADDYVTKVIILLNNLLSQTEECFNVTLSGGSSEGKTYLVLEVVSYFPQEEVIKISNPSPTAFHHENGELVDEKFNPIGDEIERLGHRIRELESVKKAERKPKEERELLESIAKLKRLRDSARKLIDYSGKVVVVLDVDNKGFIEKLRSVLSHDDKIIDIPITNPSTHKTEHILIKGPFAANFATTIGHFDEQELTRNMYLSPEVTQDKLAATQKLIARKRNDSEAFERMKKSLMGYRSLVSRIELIRYKGIKKFKADFPSENYLIDKFNSDKKFRKPRHNRDIPRLYSLSEADALLNCYNRRAVPGREDTIVFTPEDVDRAFELYGPIAEANEHNVTPELMEIHKLIVSDGKAGLSKDEIKDMYLKHMGYRIEDTRLVREIIPALVDAGLLSESKDQVDHRKRLYSPV